MNNLELQKNENNNISNKVFIDVSEWKKDLIKKSLRCKDRFTYINHPLVISGKAFWFNENTLCLIS